jgi:hypothetical protein
LGGNAPHAITAVNNAKLTTTDPKYGNASLIIDGASYASVESNSDFSFTGQFTIEAWIWITSTGMFVFGGNPSSSQGGVTMPSYNFYVSTTSISFFRAVSYGNYYPDKTESVTVSTGAWHHVAVTRDSSNDMRLFVDGNMAGSATNITGTLSNNSILGIGGVYNGSGYYGNGKIDELRVSNIARYVNNFTPIGPFSEASSSSCSGSCSSSSSSCSTSSSS